MPLTAEEELELLRLLESEERDAAKNDLIRFAQYVDPLAAKWYSAVHLRQIASMLERVERGECKRLIVSVPPRSWKSSLATIKFSLWYLGRNPKHSIILVSYAQQLADAFSKQIRTVVETSNEYKLCFPNVQIKADSNRADDWCLKTGYQFSLRSAGVGSGITGRGSNLLLFDDVIDPKDVQSETARESLWAWYTQVARGRLEPNGAIVIVNTRSHEDDLIGRLLTAQNERGGERWEYINLPAWDGTGYLWTDRYSAKEYDAIKQAVGDYTWRTQYLGQTSVPQGVEIRREWFEYVPNLPQGVTEQCRVVDTAWTLKKTEKGDPDYTASIGSAMANGWLYLIEPKKWRAELPDIVNWIESEKKLKPKVRFGMAQAAGEKIAKQFLDRNAIPIEQLAAETTDLRLRLVAFINFASRGMVKLVGSKEQWAQFMDEATAFPLGKHDDLLAAVAGLTQMHGLRITTPTIQKKAYNIAETRLVNAMAGDM